jgi:HK97 family phage major capsid protein
MAIKRAEEIRTRQATIATDLATIEKDLAEKDFAEGTDEHEEISLRFEALTGEFDTLDEELKPLAEKERKLDAVRVRMAEDARNREAGFSAPVGTSQDVRLRTDPWKDLPNRVDILGNSELRTRAAGVLKAYEADIPKDSTELVGRLLDADETSATAEFVIAASDPHYRSAFQKWMRDPVDGTKTWSREEALAHQRTYSLRAALSLTPGNGGYLVPFTLDSNIILTNSGSANPYRQVANIRTTTTNDWNGVTSAGVNAEWTAEGIEAADATPTVGPLKITPQKADAYVFGSYEVLQDSDFSAQFPTLLNDAKDRLEEAAFAAGTGTGQPKGVTVAGTTLGGTTGSVAGGPLTADIYALMAALPARWRGPNSRNVWLANLSVINQMRNRPKFTGATTSIVDDSGDTPRMLGKPLLESTSIASSSPTGSKCLVFLDGQQYYIVDRIGTVVVYDPIVLGTNRRASGQGAYYAYWRTGGDAAVTTAIRVLTSLT